MDLQATEDENIDYKDIIDDTDQNKSEEMIPKLETQQQKSALIISSVQDIPEKLNLPEFNDLRLIFNAKQKIIIAIDTSQAEEDTPFQVSSNDDYSPLIVLKRAVEMFVHLKSSINNQHEYALVLLEENKAKWVLDFTNNVKEIMKALNFIMECEAEDIFNLNSLFHEICNKINLPNSDKRQTVPPPYIIQTILIYNRSYTCPELDMSPEIQELLDSPYFNLDVLVLREPIDSPNKCEEIFATLQNIDKKGYSYSFSVERDFSSLMKSMGKLLNHPLQRPIQKNANYSI